MVSCGLLAKAVNASQSMVRVKLDSMRSIELPYGALWGAPRVTKTGAIPVRPGTTVLLSDALQPGHLHLLLSPVPVRLTLGESRTEAKAPQEVTRGQQRTDSRTVTTRREVGIRKRMCAWLRCRRRLCASFRV